MADEESLEKQRVTFERSGALLERTEEQRSDLLKGLPSVADFIFFIAAELGESSSIWESEDRVIAEASVTARGERDLSLERTLREVTALPSPDPREGRVLRATGRSERIREREDTTKACAPGAPLGDPIERVQERSVSIAVTSRGIASAAHPRSAVERVDFKAAVISET